MTQKKAADQKRPPQQRLRLFGIASVALLLLVGTGLAINHARREADRRSIRDQVSWAKALMQNRRADEAAAVLQSALSAVPDSPEVHLAYGDLLRRRGRWLQASEHYKECLRLRPKWIPALLGMGQLALENDAGTLAVETFGEAVRQAPNNVDAWIGLGRAYYQQRRRYDKSLEAFRRAARLAPDRTDFFSYYAETLRSTYHFDEVEAVLRRRLSAEPTDIRSHYLLAETLLESRPTPERIAEAKRELRTVIRFQPDVTLPYLTLGRLLLEQGAPQEAIECVRNALRLEPNNRQAVTVLVRAYRAVGRQKEADAAQARVNRIAAYAEQADRMAEMARRSDDPRIIRKLADLLQNAGEIDKAQRYREMAALLERSQTGAGSSPATRSPDP